MTKKYKIDEELMGSLSELTLMADQMRYELEALSEEMDGMFYAEGPEWEESEEGQKVESWISHVTELKDAIGEIGDISVDEYEDADGMVV